VATSEIAPAQDYYLLDETLSEQERAIRDRVRAFADDEVLPIINEYWEQAEFPFELVPKLAELGVAGTTIEGHGCPAMSRLGAGVVARELARADGSVNTFFGVHSGLAMGAIDMLGSEEQRRAWLPAMATLETIGAFGLTEPEHGSDSVSLETTARRTGGDYVLNGTKRWIGNASIADVTIIWARDDNGDVGAYLVPRGSPGFDPETVITGKIGKRAVWQAEITLSDVHVPVDHKLAHANTFEDATRVLNQTRGGAACFSMNLFAPSWDAEIDAGGAVLRATRLAKHAGAHRLAANLYELEPDAVVSPLHFHHHNEELLFVLSSTPAVRRSEHDVRAGRSSRRPDRHADARRPVSSRRPATPPVAAPIGVASGP
jgi:alkylation response protein AidB-like acyl-CoA dehydrogenase